MARLTFPDEGSRIIYDPDTGKLLPAGTRVHLYLDDAATVVATDLTDKDGTPITVGYVQLDAYRRLPDFNGPNDQRDTLFAVVNNGPISPVYANTDVRLDTLASRVTAVESTAGAAIPLTQRAAANGVATLDGAGTIPDAQIPAAIARDAEVTSSVAAAVAALVNSAPGTLDTLGEIATALQADESTAAALATTVAGKQPLDPDLTTIAALDSATPGALVTDGSGWFRKTYAQLKTALGLTKGDVGLGNVDNTSDANKPVSTAQAAADAAVAAAASADATAKVTAQHTADNGTYQPLDPTTVAASIPAGLGWDSVTYPITPTMSEKIGSRFRIGSVGFTPEALFDLASTARSAPGATYYVNNVTGADANNGTASGTPFKTVRKAIQAANTAAPAAGAKINVAAGDYGMADGWESTAGGGNFSLPTVDVAIIATGGRVRIGPWLTVGTPTTDGTYTNCYTITQSAGASGVIRVIDRARLNEHGVHPDLTMVATAAICNVTLNSWFYDTTNRILYLNRADSAVPSDLNTRALVHRVNFFFQNNKNIYVGDNGTTDGSGFDFIGGRGSGAFNVSMTAADTVNKHSCVISNSSFRYAGGARTDGTSNLDARGFTVEKWNGLVALFNCQADAAMSDGLNFHEAAGSYQTYVLTVNCSAADNGRLASTSNNGWTIHETVIAIDVCGEYRVGRGGTVHNIANSRAYLLGTIVADDRGDLQMGGTLPPVGVRVWDSSLMWAERVIVQMPRGTYAWWVNSGGTAKIYRKNCAAVPQPDVGAASGYDTF